jgi:hypothetical protein
LGYEGQITENIVTFEAVDPAGRASGTALVGVIFINSDRRLRDLNEIVNAIDKKASGDHQLAGEDQDKPKPSSNSFL